MASPLLQLEGVTKDYGARVVTRVLHGIDLELGHGELVALVGPSGSGKSTLLNLLGLLDRPTSGTIRYAGQDTATLDEEALTAFRGRTIGFVFQFHHLLPAFTALENVIVPLLAARGRMHPAMRERALELLDAVGLADKAHNRATDLSGGQQQRVAIARALAMDPPLILADEPTGNLDTKTAADVFLLLRRLNEQRGMAVVVVTHNALQAKYSDRVIELVDGRVRTDRRTT